MFYWKKLFLGLCLATLTGLVILLVYNLVFPGYINQIRLNWAGFWTGMLYFFVLGMILGFDKIQPVSKEFSFSIGLAGGAFLSLGIAMLFVIAPRSLSSSVIIMMVPGICGIIGGAIGTIVGQLISYLIKQIVWTEKVKLE